MSKIYCFSGTGNSLSVANELAHWLDMETVSIAKALCYEMISLEDDIIGLVFPVYNHLIPFIVKRFIENSENLKSKYIFAVCTYGDSPCIALRYLEKLVEARGGRLSAGFGIEMPYNYIAPTGIFSIAKPFQLRETTSEKEAELHTKCKSKLKEISRFISTRKSGVIETEYAVIEHLVDFLNLREKMHKSFWLKKSGYKGKTKKLILRAYSLWIMAFTVKILVFPVRPAKKFVRWIISSLLTASLLGSIDVSSASPVCSGAQKRRYSLVLVPKNAKGIGTKM